MTAILKDLSDQLDNSEVRELIDQLEYPVEMREKKTTEILNGYRDRTDQYFLGYEVDGKLLGLIGLALEGPDAAVIQHIVVSRGCRHVGVGRKMIDAACRQFWFRSISAETDQDAVGFYRKCGFDVLSLGEKYPGVERFLCTRKSMAQTVDEDAPAL